MGREQSGLVPSPEIVDKEPSIPPPNLGQRLLRIWDNPTVGKAGILYWTGWNAYNTYRAIQDGGITPETAFMSLFTFTIFTGIFRQEPIVQLPSFLYWGGWNLVHCINAFQRGSNIEGLMMLGYTALVSPGVRGYSKAAIAKYGNSPVIKRMQQVFNPSSIAPSP